MNKRSAMLMAAGLVLTLIVGGVAMSTGLTGPTPTQAAPRAGHRQKAPEPIIKTVKHTVKVHKPGTAAPATATATAPATSGSSSAGSLSGSMDDDQGISSDDDAQGEDEGDDDSGESGDDHSYDDHDEDHGGGDDRTAS